jgi:hypothetical protein
LSSLRALLECQGDGGEVGQDGAGGAGSGYGDGVGLGWGGGVYVVGVYAVSAAGGCDGEDGQERLRESCLDFADVGAQAEEEKRQEQGGYCCGELVFQERVKAVDLRVVMVRVKVLVVLPGGKRVGLKVAVAPGGRPVAARMMVAVEGALGLSVEGEGGGGAGDNRTSQAL